MVSGVLRKIDFVMPAFLLLIFSSFFFVSFALDLQKAGIYRDQNVTGWFMSEKLDGIRGYWDGKRLLTKRGYRIVAPKYFIKNFPPFALDGELWIKRGAFEEVQSVVLDERVSLRWKEVTYNIFEVPNADGNFTQRLNRAKEWFKIHKNGYVKFIKQYKVRSKKHLYEYLRKVDNLGGEGVMIKEPERGYFTKRGSEILKLKSFKDAEATVIGINPGKGRFDGMMGSLLLEMKNGVRFRLGNGFRTSDRKEPPKIGDIVTFKYFGFTKNGKPKFASFLRIRDKRTVE